MKATIHTLALPLALPLALAFAASGCALATPAPVASAESAAPVETLAARASAAGATEVTERQGDDGGTILNGKLAGNAFALAFPPGWDGGEAMLYAHGYSAPGTPVDIPANPVGKGAQGGGVMALVYGQGLAAGQSAYAKDGLGVETGTLSTKRLRDLLVKLGASKVYVVGDSMGGSIVVTLLEDYPGAFAGGLARCGVVGDWQVLMGQLYDMRASYNVLTKDTPYALPGEQDVTKSALPVTPPPPGVSPGDAVMARTIKVAMPVLMLFGAAQKNPDGPEARIIRLVASIGGFEPDPAAVATPIATAALGADDIAATAGGNPYDNMGKVYPSPGSLYPEATKLDSAIQRSKAAPAAVAYLKKWHKATGLISDPLVTMHNSIDSLVPYAQEGILAKAVAAAGRTQYLAAYTVPPMRAPLPVVGIEGYTHCGFTPEQQAASWNALHGWVKSGKRPAPDAVK